MKLISKIVTIIILCVFSMISSATEAELDSKVISLMTTHNDKFGGCMARLYDNIQTLLPECGSNWVTFSCNGQFADEQRGTRMFDQAQLSLTANKSIKVTVDDQYKIEGYCFVKRIDIKN
ncbi:hypothetical protein L4D06_10765 [Enterovibrio makurazakiensis]|uniref:hypothetical protein n=1 Tax=Enterovibrio makurazakiensis TaxID=2910232 RepID=UPI003D1AE3D6